MIVVAWCMALFARFNFEVPPLPFLVSGFNALPIVIIVQGLLLWKFGLYRGLWRFASLQDLWNIIRSAVLGAVFVTIALFFVNRLTDIPRSILILYPVFLLLLLGAPRLSYRIFKDRTLSLRQIGNGTRVIIVGAGGEGGETLVRDMLRDAEYGDVLRLSFDNVLLELPTGAESALDMVLASSSFRVGELAGLTDESKVVLVRRLLREGVLCQNSAQPHAALP